MDISPKYVAEYLVDNKQNIIDSVNDFVPMRQHYLNQWRHKAYEHKTRAWLQCQYGCFLLCLLS